jgi:LPXTG-motif cell wall-anchored protein
VIVASARLGLRMLFAATLVLIALLLFAGRAHADEAVPPTTPSVGGTNPPASSSTPPAESSTAPPAATAPPASGNPPAPAPTDNSSATAPPPQTQTAPPPTGVQAEPTPSTPAGAPGPPQNTNDQGATVDTNGTSVANTGANTGASTAAAGTPAPTGNSATGDVTTGGSTATGTDSTSTIGQQVDVHQSEQGTVDILQIALIVNVGVAHSNSGNNLVGAAGTGSPSIGMIKSTIKTGNAGAIGDSARTGIKQAALVGNGEQSNQNAMVVNVGIAVGNSGLNITIGTLGSNGSSQSGQSVAVGTTSGQVITGSANAIGDQSKSRIRQLAGGDASGTAVLTIDQRAIIVNFGTALANSGGNFALASFDPSQLSSEEAEIVQAVLLALSPLFASDPTGSSAAGSTLAKVTTGNAQAIGNASTTDVSQSAVGHVSGDNSASSTQRATVGNLGLALANTGFNGALGGLSLNGLTQANPDLMAAQGALTQFLNLLTNLEWLNSANPFAQFAQSVDLGGVTLELGGSLRGTEFLAGWDSGFAPDGGPIPGGVRVRQISGVLNIGFATSDSGHNTVVALVTQSHQDTNKASKASTKLVSGSPEVLAQVFTGNAMAVGNDSSTLLCQTFHATVDCSWPQAPKPHPKPKPGHKPGPAPRPAPEPPVVLVEAATDRLPSGATAAAAGELPFTGGETQGLLALAGGLLAAGAALASRRRRGESRV